MMAFIYKKGLHQLTRMPFCLRKASGTFWRKIDVILSSVKWTHSLVYMDDIFVFSRTSARHIEQFWFVLTVWRGAGFTLSLKTCEFSTRSINYLRRIDRRRPLKVAPHTFEAISDLMPPTAVLKLNFFLGLCNTFRKFVPNLLVSYHLSTKSSK